MTDHELPPDLRGEAESVQEWADSTLSGTENDPLPPRFRGGTDADLANRYSEGDVVSTPSAGVGVIAGVVTEDKSAPDDSDEFDDISASPDSPTYVVIVEDEAEGMQLLKASDLEATEIETEVDAVESTKEAATAAFAELSEDTDTAELDFTMPKSWRESPQPARVIALKVAAKFKDFDGCVREMRGEVTDTDAFCAAFFDEVLGYTYWRGDSPLPGE
jgi:hypothetical protein